MIPLCQVEEGQFSVMQGGNVVTWRERKRQWDWKHIVTV